MTPSKVADKTEGRAMEKAIYSYFDAENWIRVTNIPHDIAYTDATDAVAEYIAQCLTEGL